MTDETEKKAVKRLPARRFNLDDTNDTRTDGSPEAVSKPAGGATKSEVPGSSLSEISNEINTSHNDANRTQLDRLTKPTIDVDSLKESRPHPDLDRVTVTMRIPKWLVTAVDFRSRAVKHKSKADILLEEFILRNYRGSKDHLYYRLEAFAEAGIDPDTADEEAVDRLTGSTDEW